MILYALLGVALWVFGTYLYWVHVERRLTIVRAPRVFHSGSMSPPRLLRLSSRLGVDTIIDFRGDAEMPWVASERRALEGAGLRHTHIPCGSSLTERELGRFVNIMREELTAGRRVLMHCKDGEGRAVAFAAIYRVEFEGWSPVSAYRATTRLPRALRFITLLLPFACRLSHSNSKSRVILNYVPTCHRPHVLERC